MDKNWIKIALAGVMLIGLFALLSHSADAATTPGAELMGALNAGGAHMPADWYRIADANQALICQEYSIQWANQPGGVHLYGMTEPMAATAVAESGFCG